MRGGPGIYKNAHTSLLISIFTAVLSGQFYYYYFYLVHEETVSERFYM